MKKTLSTIIRTKNRSKLLKTCLNSLSNQTSTPEEIIIIDNGSSDDTQKVIAEFKKKLPIKSYFSKIKGYPNLINFGINKASQDIISLLDDDCFVDKNWSKNIKRAHSKKSNVVIQGMTFGVPTNNIYAEIMSDHYNNWLEANKIKNSNFLKTFDSKNISVNKELVQKNPFDNSLQLGSEDIELGKRLKRKGVGILLDKTIIAYHRERSTFKEFLSQHSRIAQSESIIDKKLSNREKTKALFNKKNYLNFISFCKRIIKYSINLQIHLIIFTLFLYTSLLIVRIVGYYKPSK